MRFFERWKFIAVGAVAVAVMVGWGTPAKAVPSYARQTGLACEACHTIFPELTPFGRRFKLSGYTMTTKPGINAMSDERESRLSLVDLPPISMMVMASSTWWNKPQADSQTVNNSQAKSQNGNTQFPQQLGIFYAGRIADTMGAFLQVTYSQQSGSIGIDNSDIRFADRLDNNNLLYGITLNNNPTVQDVWNSSPAWGYPSITPQVGATPSASPLISQLAQKVAGLGAYALYKDAFYLEGSVYRSAIPGTNSTNPYDSATLQSYTIMENFSPYWRAAYERQWGHNSWEIGSYGLFAKMIPSSGTNGTTPLSPGAANTYLDWDIDTQYQYIGNHHIVSLTASFIHENEDVNSAYTASAANSTEKLDRYLATASWYYRRKYGLSATFEKLTGSTDSLLYTSSIT